MDAVQVTRLHTRRFVLCPSASTRSVTALESGMRAECTVDTVPRGDTPPSQVAGEPRGTPEGFRATGFEITLAFRVVAFTSKEVYFITDLISNGEDPCVILRKCLSSVEDGVVAVCDVC
ncbi:unnamed protein product [Arctogadus glacialis]